MDYPISFNKVKTRKLHCEEIPDVSDSRHEKSIPHRRKQLTFDFDDVAIPCFGTQRQVKIIFLSPPVPVQPDLLHEECGILPGSVSCFASFRVEQQQGRNAYFAPIVIIEEVVGFSLWQT